MADAQDRCKPATLPPITAQEVLAELEQAMALFLAVHEERATVPVHRAVLTSWLEQVRKVRQMVP